MSKEGIVIKAKPLILKNSFVKQKSESPLQVHKITNNLKHLYQHKFQSKKEHIFKKKSFCSNQRKSKTTNNSPMLFNHIHFNNRKGSKKKNSKDVAPTYFEKAFIKLKKASFSNDKQQKKNQMKQYVAYIQQSRIKLNGKDYSNERKRQGIHPGYRKNHFPLKTNRLKINQNQTNDFKIHEKNNQKLKKYQFLNTAISFINSNTTCTKKQKSYDKPEKKYQIIGQLGVGAYAAVSLGIEVSTQQKVAIKKYIKGEQFTALKQIEILKKINHPNIAKLLDTLFFNNQLLIVTQYAGINSLFKYLISMPQHRIMESESKRIFYNILSAIDHLHSINIVHRDIKAQNILINRHKFVKLIDFGFSLYSQNQNSKIDTYCGTPTYMAPEIVSKYPHCPIYTDLWSLGVLYYIMLQGNYPFRSKKEDELFNKIKSGQYQWIFDDISDKSKWIISNFLQLNPLKRLKPSQVHYVNKLMTQQWKHWFLQQ